MEDGYFHGRGAENCLPEYSYIVSNKLQPALRKQLRKARTPLKSGMTLRMAVLYYFDGMFLITSSDTLEAESPDIG